MTYKLAATLSSVFDTINDTPYRMRVSEPENITFNEDPLVLSCTQYRLSTEVINPDETRRLYGIKTDAAALQKLATQEDRDLAVKIRTYYGGKIAFAKLRGNKMSKFREDLAKFISIEWNGPAEISENFLGMIYKLPYFYEHDLLLVNEVFETEYHEIKKPQRNKDEVTLTYIRSVNEYQKKNPSIKYWFKDEHSNRICVSVEKMNPLIPAWEECIKKPVTIKGNYIERAYDTLHFYRVNPGWKIVG
jgi:hypothetical protein